MSCPVLALRDRLAELQAEEDAKGCNAALTREQHAIYWALPTVEPATWEGAAIALTVLAEEVLEGILKGWVSEEAGPSLMRSASAFRNQEAGAAFWGLRALDECVSVGYPADRLRHYLKFSAIVQNQAGFGMAAEITSDDHALGRSA